MDLKAATVAGVLTTVMPAAYSQACVEPSGYPSAQEEWKAAPSSGGGHHHHTHKHHQEGSHHHTHHTQNPDFGKPHSNKVGPADFE